MNQELLLRAAKLNKQHHRKDRVHRAARFLSFVVVLCTVWSLMLPAITLNGEVVCGFEEHTHGDECYETRTVPACGLEESEGHTHGDDCYAETEAYICGLEESEGGELICGLEESKGHTHDEGCYEDVLICEIPESEEHEHNEECYESRLTCELKESEGHSHTEACYSTGHIHTDACLGTVKTLICEIPESAGHTHSEECGTTEERVLVCEKPEHTHTDDCYPEASDNSADTETAAYWESTFANVTLTGNYADDVLAIAETQLGYHESTKNFQYVGSFKKGYTRYGAWYGDPYGDWCAMFVSFCMRYAGVPESVIPSSSVCNSWTVLLDQLGRFEKAGDYTPRPGDVIFFDTDGEGGLNATHVGLVAWVGETSLGTIEGNAGDCVCTNEYSMDSAVIYGYGRLGDKVDETVLTYTDSNINAELTVSPALDGEAELQIEKLDPAEDETLWKNMAAPVAEQMLEEEDEPDALELYRFSLLKNGEPLELTEDYALTLDATVPAPVTDEEREEPSESVQSFALSVLTEEELKALEEQEEAEQLQREDEEEIDPVAVLLTALMPETEEKQEVIDEKEKPLPSLKAEKLAQEPADEPGQAKLRFDGSGMFYGFALAAMPEEAEAPVMLMSAAPKLGESSTAFTPTANVASHKQIDRLYDNGDDYETAEYQDKYRLHLDAGELKYAEPIDLLIVVDRSRSMNTKDMMMGEEKQRRDTVVSTILNGENNAVTKDGLVYKFLSLHPENKVAVMAFHGDRSVDNGGSFTVNSDGFSIDTVSLLPWTNKASWDGTAVNCKTTDDTLTCTDYCAAYLAMSKMLEEQKDDGHQKLVIFLSDGVPTYYLAKDDGEYKRYGDGNPDGTEENSNQTKCKNGTLDFFSSYSGGLATIYTIGIGNDEGFDTDVLEEMSNATGGKFFHAKDSVAQLEKNFETIVYGETGKLTGLILTDTLSEYVAMSGNITVKAGDTKLYELVSVEGAFEDVAGESGNFTEYNTYTPAEGGSIPMLQKVEYDPTAKTITASFNPDAALDVGMKYELAFDVELTAAAAIKYAMNGRYNATGAPDTDYGDNKTSVGQDGFHSNTEATASYTYNSMDYQDVLPKPVVQAVEGTEGHTSDYTLHGYITQHKTIDWLGDKTDNKTDRGNADTDLDDNVTAEAMTDFYRLYLDAGQMKASEPMDVLFIVDRSGSMQTERSKKDPVGAYDVQYNGTTIRRDQAVNQILNGTTDKNATGDALANGLIAQFLSMNPKNQVAVGWFAGYWEQNETITDPNNDYGLLGSTPRWVNSSTIQYYDATGKDSNGTNYAAGLYQAHELLKQVKYDGNKKAFIFLSDGLPTFTTELTVSDDGETWSISGRSGDGSTDGNQVGTKTINAITQLKNYINTFTPANKTTIYTVGIGDFKTDYLDLLRSSDQTLTTTDYNELLSEFEKIIYGESGDFKTLNITDTLSPYVDLYASNADIKVTVTSHGVTKTLYERSDATGWTGDSTSEAGRNGKFTADNTYTTADGDKVPLLKSVSYDSTSKTISVIFNEDAVLEKSAKYELSYNVKVTQKAYDEFKKNVDAQEGASPDDLAVAYAGMLGDAATDYGDNKSSSGHPGFRSNTKATAAYQLGDTLYDIPYDHPVVQASYKDETLDITVEHDWPEGVEPPEDAEVKVKLYQSADGGETLTPTTIEEEPVIYTLKADNKWTQTYENLPRKDESGKELSYYVVAKPLKGYYTSYVDSTTVPIGGKPTVSGVVTITKPEGTGDSYTGLAVLSSTPGVILPDTGGSGTALFTGFGLALLALGAALTARQTRIYKRERKTNIKGKISMKKALALLMTLVMVFALGVTAFAAEPESGSITISNATLKQTYTLYKIFDATIDIGNNPVSVAYTYKGTLPKNDYFDQDTAGNIRIKDAGKDASGHLTPDAITFLGTLKGDAPETKVADSNTVVFENLDYGYYYIESTLDTLGNGAVSVDSTTPNAVLIDKNQGPTWYDPEGEAGTGTEDLKENWLGKWIVLADGNKVKENTVDFGETVSFEVAFNATNYVGDQQVRTYFVRDTIDPGFTLKKDSFKVYIGKGSSAAPSTAYDLKFSDDGQSFIISLPWDKDDGSTLYDANEVITVTYNATLNNKAVIAGDGNLNKAYYDYRLDSDSEKVPDPDYPDQPSMTSVYHGSTEETTTTYSFALGLTKIDGQDKHTLKGAEFSLKLGDSVIKGVEVAPGVYRYSTGKDALTKFATDDKGMLVIKGLKEGEYQFTEETAPKGYNRLLAPVTLKASVEDVETYSDKYEYYFDENGDPLEESATGCTTVVASYGGIATVQKLVENERGVELPVTGGMGTTLFYVVGGLLVFGAALLLITKKRMKAGK